jgi:hypothetical protein
MSRNRPFTPEEDARLRKLRDQGLEMSEIAAAMGRSHGSVKLRVHHLKLPTVRGKQGVRIAGAWEEVSFLIPGQALAESAAEWKARVAKLAEMRQRAIEHAARVRTLPSLTKAEADALIAAALAAGKRTVCPPRAVAALTGGLSL